MGGAAKREGGAASEVLPIRKGGGWRPEQVLAMVKWGRTKFWGSFYVVA